MRNRNQPSLLSTLLRLAIVVALVAGVGFYAVKNDVISKAFNGEYSADAETSDGIEQWLDNLVAKLSGEPESTAVPGVNDQFGEPDEGAERPYEKYSAKAIEVLEDNIGRYSYTPGYSRDEFFIHDSNSWNKVSRKESQDAGWKHFDNGKCTVREAILIEQGDGVEYNDSCKITAGTFSDKYGRVENGKVTYFSSPKRGDLDVDHIIALSLAWRSGMDKADETLRNMLANDRANLLLSEPGLNRSKGGQSIDTWFPPQQSKHHCDYADRYAYTKAKYNLTVTTAEFKELEKQVKQCNANT